MRTEYRFFNNDSGFVSNIFYFDEDWQQPNNFILPDILFWLADNRKRHGEIRLEGYFSVGRIADELQKRGFVRDDVCQACTWLLQRNLVEADHMNQTAVTFGDAVKITAAGFFHIRVFCERLEYLYGVLTVTPVSDSTTAQLFAEFLRTENQLGQLSGFQQSRAVEALLGYLTNQHGHLTAAYPEFGAERSGSSFVIQQIQSALHFFRNPTARHAQRNLLDE